MASKYWIKLYHEMLDERKVAQLGDTQYRRWIECLLIAGDLGDGGWLPPTDDMSWRLRVTVESLTQDLSTLAKSGLVELREDNGKDRWYISNWDKRQKFNQAEYMRRWRKETGGGEPLPGRKRGRPRESGNTFVNSSVNNIYRDIDKDKDIDIDKRRGGAHTIEYLPDEVAEIRTAILGQVKTPMKESNEQEFNEAAYAVFGWDATPAEVGGFGAWWQAQAKRASSTGKTYPYTGLPALKSFEQEYRNYQRSMTSQPEELPLRPGIDFKVFAEDES